MQALQEAAAVVMSQRFPDVGALLLECVHLEDALRPCSGEVLDRLCAALFDLSLRTLRCGVVRTADLRSASPAAVCSLQAFAFHVLAPAPAPPPCCLPFAAPVASGPFPTAWFLSAATFALRLADPTARKLQDQLGLAPVVTLAEGEAALARVAEEEAAEAAPAAPGLPPFRSRCYLNRCRRYHLKKALSMPPPPAPEIVGRTSTSITFRVRGSVPTAPRAPPTPRPPRPLGCAVVAGHVIWAHATRMLDPHVGHACWDRMLDTHVGHACWTRVLAAVLSVHVCARRLAFGGWHGAVLQVCSVLRAG
jgi:hypothetical protein